MQTLSARTHPC